MSKKIKMESFKAFLKRNVAHFLLFAAVVLAAGCSSPSREGEEHTGDGDGLVHTKDQIALSLYFPNLDYDQADTDSKAVLPVQRFVQKTESVARATVTELLRGPSVREAREYGVGPAVGRQVALSDIYIKNGICVVHIDYDGPLFSGLSVPQAEAESLFMQSVVYSLAPLPSVKAVWLFYREGPWLGDYWQYYGPVAVPGRVQEYGLYYRSNNPQNFDNIIWETVLSPVMIAPEGEHPFQNGGRLQNGLIYEVIERLSSSYDQEHGPTLPKNCRALSFDLRDGVLTINLSGKPPSGSHAARIAVRSLVYTFTELPEVKRVMATFDGELLRSGNLVWDIPLGRIDLDLLNGGGLN